MCRKPFRSETEVTSELLEPPRQFTKRFSLLQDGSTYSPRNIVSLSKCRAAAVHNFPFLFLFSHSPGVFGTNITRTLKAADENCISENEYLSERSALDFEWLGARILMPSHQVEVAEAIAGIKRALKREREGIAAFYRR